MQISRSQTCALCKNINISTMIWQPNDNAGSVATADSVAMVRLSGTASSYHVSDSQCLDLKHASVKLIANKF